jgi:hypothetical protein
MIDHDRLFKELLTEFYADFIELFLPDLAVLRFQCRVIQLSRLNWRDFLRRPNPVAQVESLAEDLLDFTGPADRERWLRNR